jgi:hypothetical protein
MKLATWNVNALKVGYLRFWGSPRGDASVFANRLRCNYFVALNLHPMLSLRELCRSGHGDVTIGVE